MTLTNDCGFINNSDDELSQDQMNDLLMNWALMSMNETPCVSTLHPLNFDDAALDQKAKID